MLFVSQVTRQPWANAFELALGIWMLWFFGAMIILGGALTVITATPI